MVKSSEILKEEYPHIYDGYMVIVEEQLELFSKKHLDYVHSQHSYLMFSNDIFQPVMYDL